ncbi:MAG: major capsid protein [Rhodospirillales bacterium]|nr:major capsid protein [Rhodospirillales bacterium]
MARTTCPRTSRPGRHGGLDLYAMTIPDRERNAWVKVEVYSYPLFICTRPEMLQRAKRA